jgi:SulP family sulfate permease
LVLGALALAILFLMPRAWRRYVPPQLLALALGTLLAIGVLGAGSYRAIGEIPSGLPTIQLPSFSPEQWRTILIDALVLGMVGSIDALLTVEDIPKAVLAGMAIKVGIDIIDWGFLRRAHRVSLRGTLIMYGVVAMTVRSSRLAIEEI